MAIDDLTIGEAKKLAQMFCGNSEPDNPYKMGSGYFIRTVTHYFVGRLVEVGRHELVLEECGWVADTGRFSECLASGVVAELEPHPSGRVLIGRGAIIDACEWPHGIPRAPK